MGGLGGNWLLIYGQVPGCIWKGWVDICAMR